MTSQVLAKACLARISRRASTALLYHGSYAEVPTELKKDLHNVRPAIIHRQLEVLKRTFKFVALDEYADAGDRRGLASVTFDDAYRCVFEEALPVLESLGIPATVFVNTCTLQGKPIWRDKLRVVINSDLEADWDRFTRGRFKIEGMNSYRSTKDPRVNSAEVDRALDEFLGRRNLSVPAGTYCQSPEELPRSPLLSYGNHSHAHYLLSSLSREQQQLQIETARDALRAIPGINRTGFFAVPFGGEDTFDANTVAILQDLGYKGLLLSRHRLNRRPASIGGLRVVERLMLREGRLLRDLLLALARSFLRDNLQV